MWIWRCVSTWESSLCSCRNLGLSGITSTDLQRVCRGECSGRGGRDPGAQGATAERTCWAHTGRERPLPLGAVVGRLCRGAPAGGGRGFQGLRPPPRRLSVAFSDLSANARGPCRPGGCVAGSGAPGSTARGQQCSGGGIKPTGGQNTFPTGREEIRKMMSPKWAPSFKTL